MYPPVFNLRNKNWAVLSLIFALRSVHFLRKEYSTRDWFRPPSKFTLTNLLLTKCGEAGIPHSGTAPTLPMLRHQCRF